MANVPLTSSFSSRSSVARTAGWYARWSFTCMTDSRQEIDEAVDAGLGGRNLRIEPLERVDEDLRDAEVPRPVVVGRHDVPRRIARSTSRGSRPRTRSGTRPTSPGRRDRRAGTSTASPGRRREPAAACAARRATRGGTPSPPTVPSSVSSRSNAAMCAYRFDQTSLVGKLAHAHRDDVLVVRAVEDPDLAARRARARAHARGSRARARRASAP